MLWQIPEQVLASTPTELPKQMRLIEFFAQPCLR
jgi:hypothetical protein